MDLSKLKNPGDGIGPKGDTAKLVILSVLAAVVIAAFIFFNYKGIPDASTGEDINPNDYLEIPDVEREPTAKIDHALLEQVEDGEVAQRVIKEKEPYLHLIKEASKLVYGDMERLNIRQAVASEILTDTDAARGLPFEVKGNLQWFEKVTDLDFELYRGFITSYDGDFYYFTVRDMPDEIAIGDVVKLQGFFFKAYSFPLPGEEKRVNDAVFLIGKKLIPSFYTMDPVTELDYDLLDRVYDFGAEDIVKPLQEEPLYHLLSFIQHLDDDELKALDEQDAFKEYYANKLIKESGQHRGEAVKVLGELVWISEKILGADGENPLGIRSVYHGILYNWQGGFCYFLSFANPDWVKPKELVYGKGIFFRSYAYLTRSERLQPAAVVVFRDFEKFIIPEDNTFLYVSYAIGIGAILACLGFFIHMWRDRRHNRAYREHFIKRKKRELTRIMDRGPVVSRDDGPKDAAGG